MTSTAKIKQRALELGFSAVGVSKAEELTGDARRLEAWLNKGMHGEMRYMEANFDKRMNPKVLMPEAKSIISVLASYTPVVPQASQAKPNGKISVYAQGQDYHEVIKSKLYLLFDYALEIIGSINGRAFVDSAPLMDKAFAARAGLGWMGKHTNLINRNHGSYFFIGSLLLDCKLDFDFPLVQNYCGSCTACIDLCPTQAITAFNEVDARKCISYLTIELKRDFTDEEQSMLGEWLFGCDICQEVCPWNRFASAPSLRELDAKPDVKNISETDILQMTKSHFKKTFGETPIFRSGLRRLKRNARAVKANLKG
jgi:epoxyqueuosine reductase